MASLQKSGEPSPGEAFRAFFEQASRLNDLCDRLSTASPAAFLTIQSVLASSDVDAVEGGEGGHGEEDVLAAFAADKRASGAPPSSVGKKG